MARQKTVFKTDEIAHLWAHRTQQSARNAQGNLYFDGATIWSYGSHHAIASHVERNGERAILMNIDSYSVTTNRHHNLVERAIPRGTPVFHVQYIRDAESHMLRNIDSYRDRATELAAKCKRARVNKDYYLNSLWRLVREANAFCHFYNQPLIFSENVNGVDLSDIEHSLQVERTRRIEREKLLQAKREADAQATIERWLAGESVYIPYSINRAYLRVVGDTVETSRGAEFPVRHAALGLALVERVRASGIPYARNGHTIHLGHYAIDSIDAQGNVHAGCHYVLYEDIARISSQLRRPITSDALQSQTETPALAM